MDFEDVLKTRHSVREYSGKKIPAKILDKILSLVDYAPSGGGLKSYRIFQTQDEKIKKKLCSASLEQEFILQAPCVFVFIADRKKSSMKYGKRGEELYALQDATIAAAYFQLAAANFGLSTVWVGAFDVEKVSKICRCKRGELPVAIIPIGYKYE